jgi:amino acid transporter
VSSFFVAYISLILFVVLYLGHKIVFRTKFVRPIDADLDTGRTEPDNAVYESQEPTSLWQKIF